MKLFQPKRIILPLAVVVISAFLLNGISLNGCARERTAGTQPCPSIRTAQDTIYFSPEKDQIEINSEIVYYLTNYHYRKQPVDDTLSDKVFQRYLSDLDWSRLYFLQSDIDDFRVLKFCLDDAMKRDDLQPAFMIYNRYQTRVIERLAYVIDLVENRLDRFDFTRDEKLKIDRKDSPWPKDTAELDDLWRKRIKNEVLNLKLSGKEPDKIKELLDKRYKKSAQPDQTAQQ